MKRKEDKKIDKREDESPNLHFWLRHCSRIIKLILWLALSLYLAPQCWLCYTLFTRSSWLDELLYVKWTSCSSMFARCLFDDCFV